MTNIKWLPALAVLVILCALGGPGDVLASDKIVFLRLEVTADSVALIRASVVDGSLKQQRVPDTSRAIQYRVFLDDGTEWTTGSRNDARIRRYEYEDSDNPGQLRSTMVILDTAFMVLRVPYHERLSHVECSRKPVLESEMIRGPERRPFGRFDLDLAAEVDNE
jgi:hypothetical protein